MTDIEQKVYTLWDVVESDLPGVAGLAVNENGIAADGTFALTCDGATAMDYTHFLKRCIACQAESENQVSLPRVEAAIMPNTGKLTAAIVCRLRFPERNGDSSLNRPCLDNPNTLA